MTSPDRSVSRPGLSARFPVGAGAGRAAFEGDVHATLHRLRETEPVSWVPALGGWLVTGHALATGVLRDAVRFTVEDERFSTGRVVGPSMLSTDGARHRAHREPFESMFLPGPVGKAAVAVAAAADALIDRFVDQHRVELRSAFAAPLAVKVITDFLGLTSPAGVPGSDVEATMLGYYRTIVAAVSALTPETEVPDDARRAVASLADVVTEHVRDAPEGPLARLFGDESPLPTGAVHANVAVLLFGAIETSEAMIANAIMHLFGSPATEAGTPAWPAGEDLARACRRFVAESLRLEPAAAVVDRYATEPVLLESAPIAAGDLVLVSLAGANRDPSVFPNPDLFDPHRPNLARQLAFARGPHTCLGIHLATLQATLALQRLVERVPALRVDAGASTPPTGLIFRKPERVVGRW